MYIHIRTFLNNPQGPPQSRLAKNRNGVKTLLGSLVSWLDLFLGTCPGWERDELTFTLFWDFHRPGRQGRAVGWQRVPAASTGLVKKRSIITMHRKSGNYQDNTVELPCSSFLFWVTTRITWLA
jgi:hypothetical protein